MTRPGPPGRAILRADITKHFHVGEGMALINNAIAIGTWVLAVSWAYFQRFRQRTHTNDSKQHMHISEPGK